MRPAFFDALLRPEGRDFAAGTKEKKMRTYSLTELFNLTRSELFDLQARIVAELPTLPQTDREIALGNLRRIRRVLSHPRFAPS